MEHRKKRLTNVFRVRLYDETVDEMAVIANAVHHFTPSQVMRICVTATLHPEDKMAQLWAKEMRSILRERPE